MAHEPLLTVNILNHGSQNVNGSFILLPGLHNSPAPFSSWFFCFLHSTGVLQFSVYSNALPQYCNCIKCCIYLVTFKLTCNCYKCFAISSFCMSINLSGKKTEMFSLCQRTSNAIWHHFIKQNKGPSL